MHTLQGTVLLIVEESGVHCTWAACHLAVDSDQSRSLSKTATCAIDTVCAIERVTSAYQTLVFVFTQPNSSPFWAPYCAECLNSDVANHTDQCQAEGHSHTL